MQNLDLTYIIDQVLHDDAHLKGRDRRAYDERGPRHQDYNHSRAYKEDRRKSDRYVSEDTSYRHGRDRARHISESRGSSPDQGTYVNQESRRHRHRLTGDEPGSSTRPNNPSEHGGSRSERFSKHHHKAEWRGRSLSRSRSTHSKSRHSSSRSSSASFEDSHRYSRKRRRHRSRSKSVSRDRKEGKSRKHKRSSSRRKETDRERSESKRSVLTGKKIKLKVKKDRGDDERDAKRQELLKFLNSAYE